MSIIKHFSVEKAIQVLYLLQEKTGETNYLKLLKLIFFADRYHLRTYGVPLTFDNYNAMKLGPVCSNIYYIIKKDRILIDSCSEKQGELISASIETIEYDTKITTQNSDYLSISDKIAIEFSIDLFSQYSKYQLAKITHDYPEWKKFDKVIMSGESKNERMYYEDFFNNPDLSDSVYIQNYLNGIDPFAIDSTILESTKNQFFAFTK